MPRFAIRSIIAGGLISVFVSSFLGAVSVVFVLLLLRIAHTPDERVSSVTTAIVHGSPAYIGAQLFIGAGCALLGGYIAARLARHDERLNGALSSVFGVASLVASIALGHDPEQLILQLLMMPVTVLAALSGGYLRELEGREKRAVRQ